MESLGKKKSKDKNSKSCLPKCHAAEMEMEVDGKRQMPPPERL